MQSWSLFEKNEQKFINFKETDKKSVVKKVQVACEYNFIFYKHESAFELKIY